MGREVKKKGRPQIDPLGKRTRCSYSVAPEVLEWIEREKARTGHSRSRVVHDALVHFGAVKEKGPAGS